MQQALHHNSNKTVPVHETVMIAGYMPLLSFKNV
jgi:hypothetical protein